MFKLSTNATFKRKVTVFTPTDDGETKGTFTAQFKRLPQSRINQILSGRAYEDSDDETDVSLLDEILISVDGISDDQGQPLPCDDSLLTAIKDDSCARVALVASYFKAITEKNQQKN